MLTNDFGAEKAKEILEMHGITKLDPIDNYEKCYRDADSFTVDPNSNVSSSTPSRILAEMMKPHVKLVSLYKIYEWLDKIGADPEKTMKSILSGGIYVHDLSVGMNLPYTYCKDEVVIAKYKGKLLLVSFEELFGLVEEPEEQVEDGVFVKKPKGCFVLDKDGFTKVLLLTKKKRHRQMLYIKTSSGRGVIVTDNHPMITEEGECEAKDCFVGKTLYTIFDYDFIDGKTNFDRRYAYLFGVVVAAGTVDLDKCIVKIHVNGITSGRIIELLDSIGIKNFLVTDAMGKRYICILDEIFVEKLLGSGCYNLKKGLTIPYDVLMWDVETICAFVNGIVDSIYNGSVEMIETENRVLLNKLFYLLRFCDFTMCEIEPYKNDTIKYRAKISPEPVFENDWSLVTTNMEIDIDDEFIYDITTASTTLIVNGIYSHNCVSLQTLKLLIDGQEWEILPSSPPRWASTYTEQVKETIMCMSQSCTGAINPADFFICYFIVLLDEYMRNTNRTVLNDLTLKSLCKAIVSRKGFRKKIENDFQRFIYPLNRPFRIANQSPFTNVTLSDRPGLETIMENFGYFDFIKAKFNVSDINRKLILDIIVEIEYIFASLMARKDPITGMPIRFPVTTISVTVDENKNILDEDFFNKFIALNTEGLFNIYISDLSTMKLMQCCRFKMDLNEIFGKGLDSFGNGGLGIGSRRVVTINLARCAYESGGDIKRFFSILEDRLNEARNVLEAHRQYLLSIVDTIPIFKYGWLDINRTFGTFGIVAFTEAIEFMGYELLNDNGNPNHEFVQFGEQILEFISSKVSEFSKQDGLFYNIEQIPAEGAAVFLPKLDNIIFGKPYFDRFIYSNQFVPLWYDVDLFTKIDIESNFYKYLSGGGITHLNVAGRLSSGQVKALTKYAIGSSLEHFAINPNFCICENNHVSIGKFETCPECGGKIKDNITRVVGYFTPVSSWNSGRKKEYRIRFWNQIKEKQPNSRQLKRFEEIVVRAG